MEFVPDRDESAPGVRFSARGHGSAAVVSAADVVLRVNAATESGEDRVRRTLRHPGESLLAPPPPTPASAVRVEYVGADAHARLSGEDPCAWRTNFFLGDEPSLWRRGVRTFRGVTARGVWPGVDMRWYAGGCNLEFDLVVTPGADAGCIAFAVSGVAADDRVAPRIDDGGDLVMETCCGSARLRRPVSYELRGGERRPVDGRFVLGGTDAAGRTAVTFAIGRHDPSATLVIDPAVVATYATLGGSGTDQALGIAAHPSGHGAYLLCSTDSWASWFPATQPLGATTTGDVDGVVVHVDDTGAILAQAVYGGSTTEYPAGIAVGATGNVFVGGSTFSTNFPVTTGTVRGANGTSAGVTVLRLTPSLDLDAATVYGGSSFDYGRGLAVGPADDVFICGNSQSTNLVATAGAYRAQKTAFYEAFLLRLDAALTTVEAFTFLGDEVPNGIAMLGDGDVGIAGYTTSATFPVLSAAQSSLVSGDDGVVLKISPDATTLRYATYFGGAGNDFLFSIAAVPAGAPWPTTAGGCIVAGVSDSTSVLGTTRDAAHGGNDVYVGWFGADGTLSSTTFLGGAGNDSGGYVASTPNAAYVLGYTDSFADFPVFYGAGGGASDLIGWTLTPRADGGFDATTPGRIGSAGFDVPAGIARQHAAGTKLGARSPKLVDASDLGICLLGQGQSTAVTPSDDVAFFRLVNGSAMHRGNVNAVVTHGTLKLTGDSAGASVVIDKAASDSVTVEGVDGTTVNGANALFQDIGVINFASTMGGGDNSLEFLSVGFKTITVLTGDGNDTLTFAPTTQDTSRSPPVVKVVTGKGDDRVIFKDGICKSLTVRARGNLVLDVADLTVDARLSVDADGDLTTTCEQFTCPVAAFRCRAGTAAVRVDSAMSGGPVAGPSTLGAVDLNLGGGRFSVDVGTSGTNPPTAITKSLRVATTKTAEGSVCVYDTAIAVLGYGGGAVDMSLAHARLDRVLIDGGWGHDTLDVHDCDVGSPAVFIGGPGSNDVNFGPGNTFETMPVGKRLWTGTGYPLIVVDASSGDTFAFDSITRQCTLTLFNPDFTQTGTVVLKGRKDGSETVSALGDDFQIAGTIDSSGNASLNTHGARPGSITGAVIRY